MTKPLLFTALGAFVAAVVCFALAGASAFGAASAAEPAVSADISPASRDLAWTGGDSLSVTIPADVHFTQGPAGAVHITGPRNLLDHVVLRDGKLQYDRDMSHVDRPPTPMHVTMTAPGVKHFVIAGSKDMTVDRYRQDDFDATIAGSGQMRVRGETGRIKLTIAGSGDLDAADLASRTASITIAGSGDATVAPLDRLSGLIVGSGKIRLMTHPRSVDVHNIGSGRVVEAS